jgi:hypothetical protein
MESRKAKHAEESVKREESLKKMHKSTRYRQRLSLKKEAVKINVGRRLRGSYLIMGRTG